MRTVSPAWACRRLLVALPVIACAGSASADIDHTHAGFDVVLQSHVENGLVSYSDLLEERRSSTSSFTRYLDELACGSCTHDTTWSRDQRLAYWINAYNAFTLELIVNDYPIDAAWYMWVLPFLRFFVPANSILMIGGRWDGKTFASVRGPITLGAIEHGILRAELEEPRIHFAIVCASLGCPTLRSRAYHPTAIGEELDEAAIAFITDPEKVRVEPDGTLKVSKIFGWFREDFDAVPPGGRDVSALDTSGYGRDAGVARWLAAYGSESLFDRVTTGPFEIDHLGYDWSLNEQGGGAD